MRKADTIRDELKRENLERAEPDMRRAAERVGATLLPNTVKLTYYFDRRCEKSFPAGVGRIRGRCPEQTEDGRAFWFLDSEGKRRIAVPVQFDDWTYARLARRGDTLVVLEPKVSRRKLGSRAACECDGMPRPPADLAFVLEDAPIRKVERVVVSITVNHIDWECETYLG